jgi:dTDP-4-amino-4,6-dideoxygalactose transaminase
MLQAEIMVGWKKLFKKSEWTGGSDIVQFEQNFAKLHDSKFAVAVSSGTMSLWTTLQACNFPPGSEVITTPMTFSATGDAIVLTGLKPVFADVDPLMGNLDPDSVKTKITPKTKAILVVHLYGMPADMPRLVRLAKKHKLMLIEDASHAHGATLNGKKVGSFGTAGCFSLYPSKTLGALGNGGVIVTQSRNLALKLRHSAHHGMVTSYKHTSFGLNGLMDCVQAVALNVKLKHLIGWLKKKRAIAARYNAALQVVGHQGMVSPENVEPGLYSYAIQVPRRSAFQAWCKKFGIETKIYYPIPLHLQPSYKKFGYRKGDFSNAERFAKQTVSLPLFPEMTETQIKKVIKTVQQFFKPSVK